MITLHPVKRAFKASNRYCGPSILSILTGLDTRETARLLRHVSGKRSIKGTSTEHLVTALSKLGYAALKVGYYDTSRPTLAQWSRANPSRQGVTYLINVGHHWALVQGRRYACGINGITPLKGCVKWRARVKQVWTIHRNSDAPTSPAAVIPAMPPKAAPVPERLEAKRLAAQWGVKLESVYGYTQLDPGKDGVYVYPPAGLYGEEDDTDPLNGQRIGFSWQDVLYNVRVYVAALQARPERPLGQGEPVSFVQS